MTAETTWDTDVVARVANLARERFAPRAAHYDRTATFPLEDFDDLFAAGLNAPTIPRETFASPPSLGSHYPIVDYVVNGATVSNCTFNIVRARCWHLLRRSTFPTARG